MHDNLTRESMRADIDALSARVSALEADAAPESSEPGDGHGAATDAAPAGREGAPAVVDAVGDA